MRSFAVRVVLVLALAATGAVAGAAPASADSPACPCRLWSDTDTPAVVDVEDPNAVELGVQFTSDVAAPVTGVRFYKSAANTGTHVGSLWTADGTLLARATFTDETASGWQQVAFSPAVSLVPGMRYVASYHAPNGHYSADPGYFSTGGRDNGILHAPGGDPAVPNGVYAYSPVPTFPTGTYNGNNYWVDVVVGTAGPTLTGLTVTPPASTLLTGATASLAAAGTYSDGSTRDHTAGATWTSSAPAVASVSPAGTVTAHGPGTATITATFGSRTGTASVTVRKVTGLALGGLPASLAKGLSRPLTATATYDDGTTADVTASATWASTAPAVATVSAAGLLQAVGPGTAGVSAAFGGATASGTVTVTPAAVAAIAVTPGATTLRPLRTLTLRATATYTDGTTADVTGRARWSTSNLFVAYVGTLFLPGRVTTLLLPGTAQITASLDGVRGSAAVTVRW